jgi:hypothetical protein
MNIKYFNLKKYKVNNKIRRAQAVLIAFLLILVVIIAVVLPFMLQKSSTTDYEVQDGSSSSIISSEKQLQVEEFRQGDPSIVVYQSPNGKDIIHFAYMHQPVPFDILEIFYYNTSLNEWVKAFPGSFSVDSNATLYLYTPPYYSGEIEILTTLGNAFYIPIEHTAGLTTSTNIYIVTGAGGTLVCPTGTSTSLPINTTIITTGTNILPRIAINQNITIPPGTVIIEPNGQTITTSQNATLENVTIVQKVINSGYFPISSFLTGYQSDNDNIGTISTETRNPMLQNQTLVQWFIASQGLNSPIIINTGQAGPTLAKANTPYYSTYAPQGGYLMWSGDAAIIVGNGIEINNNGGPAGGPAGGPKQQNPNNEFYIAFTVQLSNGTWITIVDPNGFSGDVAIENGQLSSGLTLAVGSFGSSQTNSQMSLYLNGTLVSQVNIPKDLHLYHDSASFMDVGSVYNISNNEIKTIPGMSGDINDGGANSYSFNGALGPGFLYNITLVQTQVQSIQSGTIPSPKDIVVLWSENTAQSVNFNVPGNPGTLCPDAVEVVNLANPNALNGYWGQGGAIPTAFAPFNDIVIWSGPAPVLFNPSVLEGKNINITFESQGILVPKNPGTYVFSANFTDNVPVEENVEQISGYANEYVTVYMNGEKVFQGSYVNNHLNVLYSNIPNDLNSPIFEYHLVKDVNITTVFTFNLADASNSTTASSTTAPGPAPGPGPGPAPGPGPGPAPGQTNSGITAIYFGLMWTPPGQSGFQYISINNIQPFPNY